MLSYLRTRAPVSMIAAAFAGGAAGFGVLLKMYPGMAPLGLFSKKHQRPEPTSARAELLGET